MTEVYDYLRVLYARLGQPYCPACRVPVGTQTADEIIDKLLSLPEGTKLYLMAPVERHPPAVREVGDELGRGSVLGLGEAVPVHPALVLDPDRVQVPPAVAGVPGDVGDGHELHDLPAARDDEMRRTAGAHALQIADGAHEATLGRVDDDRVDRARRTVGLRHVRRVPDQNAQRRRPGGRGAEREYEKCGDERPVPSGRPHVRLHK